MESISKSRRSTVLDGAGAGGEEIDVEGELDAELDLTAIRHKSQDPD